MFRLDTYYVQFRLRGMYTVSQGTSLKVGRFGDLMLSLKKIALVMVLLVHSWLLICLAAASTDFPIGYSSRVGPYAFISLIEQEQLLEQEGIKPTIIYIGGPQISQALIAGDIQMAILGAATPLRVAARGADVRFVGGATEYEAASLVVDPKITSIARREVARY